MKGWGSALRKVPVPEVRGAKLDAVVAHKPDLSRVVTIDFETYYDGDYTLRKLSTSEYIRDERFLPHMMGLKIGKGKTKVIKGDKIRATLRMIPWQTHSLLCHNASFDGFILSHHYGVVPSFYYDTLSMARGLHKNDIGASLNEVASYYGAGNKIADVLNLTKGFQKLTPDVYKQLAEYCAQDIELTFEIFQRMVTKFPEREIQLIDKTIRMFTDPVLLVDLPRVEKELVREIKEKEDILLSVIGPKHVVAKKVLQEGRELTIERARKEIASNERFAALLRAEGVDPPMKVSPSWIKKPADLRDDEKKWVYAFSKTDLEFTRLLEDTRPRVRTLVEARLSVKSTIGETRAARFLKAGENGMRLPVLLHYYGAHTGRHSAGNKMNMQNLERGGELRKSIMAPPGHVIVVADSGQIEARVNGWLWGQDDLVAGFRVQDDYARSQMALPKAERKDPLGDDRDVYCKFADLVYGREILKSDSEERFVGKVGVLGLGYQMGAERLQKTLALGLMGPSVFIELEEAKRIVRTYRRKNYKIAQGWDKCNSIIEEMARGREGSWGPISWEKEKIWLPNGMALKYPGLRSKRIAAAVKARLTGEEAEEQPFGDNWIYERKGEEAKIYGGLLCENIVQALSRIIVAYQLLDVAEKYRVVMFTHDEIVSCVKKALAEKAMQYKLKVMQTPPSWAPDLPLFAEGGYDTIYSK